MIKYPKTMHLPWSPGLQNDDRLIKSLDAFEDEIVVVTEKMDGENASLYTHAYHARSLDSRHHPSRDWMKAFHGRIKHDIPPGFRVCGENLYAMHSIWYEELESYFLGFSVWDDFNYALSWDDTLEIFQMLGVEHVPVLERCKWSEFLSKRDELEKTIASKDKEGYVVRLDRQFHFNEFQSVVAKYVRRDHVQTDQHWMAGPVVANRLRMQ